MRKILSLVFLLSFIFANAQHMTFMGIPIDGTINSFQTKLQSKGFKISPDNKYAEVGVRFFEGVFAGEKSQINVYFSSKTKTVHGVQVTSNNTTSLENVKSKCTLLEEMLMKKYGDTANFSRYDDRGFFNFFDKNGEAIGYIVVTYIAYENYYPTEYATSVIYYDRVNMEKSEAEK